MSKNMVERVARAIESKLEDAISALHVGDSAGPYPSDYEAAARAAIEAMAPATEAMTRAGGRELSRYNPNEDGFPLVAAEAWKAMITAALKP